MWWAQFAIELNFEFTAYVKNKDRQVDSERMKLRLLNKNVKADFLISQKFNIEAAMAA